MVMANLSSAENRAAACQLRRDGMTVKAIAERFQCSAGLICSWTRGISAKPRKERPARRVIVDAPTEERPSYHTDSHGYPGHEERYAAHTKRIQDFLRAHPKAVSVPYSTIAHHDKAI